MTGLLRVIDVHDVLIEHRHGPPVRRRADQAARPLGQQGGGPRHVDGGEGSGADPLSILVAYGNVLVGASSYDPVSGLALVPIPADAPLERGRNGRNSVCLGDDEQ